MEAEANGTLTVRTTLVNVNYTLQEIQEQSVSFLTLLDPSPLSLTSYSITTPLLQDYLQENITVLLTTTQNISVSLK